ncbi:MAG: LPS-assembly protein LptD [Calditrichaceae bacterium]|nr:LPS-assembly protein LptD [Calditrichaceae bacterium]RQV96492.1 MAG: LPS-assembly protein LptD [Calditrichota bacterium]
MNNRFLKNFFVILILQCFCGQFNALLGQDSDSLAVMTADSMIVLPQDSLEADSTVKKKSADIESPIKYWAKKIDLSASGNIINLNGDAKIAYQDMTLTAAHIKINRRTNTLFAEGRPDSITSDGDTVLTKTPVFTEEGEEPMYGDFIEYNFKTKRGKISGGKTEMDPGYYKGENIHKIGDSTLLVQTGYFTSCEHIDNPHYYFRSSRMRVIVKDKVIAEPVYLYIADVPVGWFPFAIFPNKKGRRSGILIPTYGESSVGGRYLRGMGYYWAPSDYFDADFMVDYYDRLGFAYRNRMQYKVRYRLNGNLYAEYYPMNLQTGKKQSRWLFGFTHSQQIDKTFSIAGSGKFVSDKDYAKQLSPNMDERLNQNIQSSITARKNWRGTKNSMSFSASHNRNLSSGQEDWKFPNRYFSRSTSSLYETFTGKSLPRKKSWYHIVNFSFNSRLINEGSKIPVYRDTDSSDFRYSKKDGIQHTIVLSATSKLLKYINVTPSFNYREDWVSEITKGQFNPQTSKVETEQQKEFAARRTFNFNVAAKTTLYGLFPINIGSLSVIRHKVDPSITFSAAPDFTDSYYGYVYTVLDSAGRPVKIDKFSKSPFGGTSSSDRQSMSISLGNLFQGKFLQEEGQEKSVDLLKMNFSTSYNFLSDSLNWSDLSTSTSTDIFGKTISFNTVHTFYKPKRDGTGKRNAFEHFPRLLTLRTSFGFSIDNKTFEKKKEDSEKKGRRKQTGEEQETDTETGNEEDEDEGTLEYSYLDEERRDYVEETKAITIPWSASFNINYSLNRSNVYEHVERIGMSARANLQLTKNWKISWNAQFDLETRDITSQNFSIYRDLHCWEMSFGWQPMINYYSFKINVKSSILKDLKVTKHPSSSSRYGYGY